MLASLIGSPATYFMAFILGCATVLPRVTGSVLKISPMALLGLAMFLISTGIITSYHYVPDDLQVAWWTVSLFAVGSIYSLILFVSPRFDPLFAASLWGAVLAAFAFAMGADPDISRKAWWFTQFSLITFGAFLCYLTIPRNEHIAQMVWAVLFIAEGVGAAQVFDCQFLHGMAWVPIVQGSACEAVYSWVGAPFVPTIITAVPLVWILYRWTRANAGR